MEGCRHIMAQGICSEAINIKADLEMATRLYDALIIALGYLVESAFFLG